MENQKPCPGGCSQLLFPLYPSVSVNGCHLFCQLWLILTEFSVVASPGSVGTHVLFSLGLQKVAEAVNISG